MSDQPFQISQGFEVLRPKSGKAYPVPCDEWNFLKKKVEDVSFSNDLFNDGGWALLGITLSTFGSLLLGAYQSTVTQIIAWAIVGVTLLSGILCLYFATQVKKGKKTQASEIMTQMELIEKRYQAEGMQE